MSVEGAVCLASRRSTKRAAALTATGMPAWQIDGLLEDYAQYGQGEAAQVSSAVEHVTGLAPRTIDRFARDYAAAFASPPV
jgi:hypothetical protein